MAKITVKIYDNDGNVVDELPYGTNGITGTNGTGQRQQVYAKTDESGNKSYFLPGLKAASDPFEKIGLDIDEYTDIQAPQVKIDGGDVVLSAPQEVLDSPLAEQIRQELQSLKGANLESQEVKDAVNALNEEIRNTVHNWTLQGTLGWTEEEFADYQRLLQAMRQGNPMSSTELFKAKRPGADFYYNDEEGRSVMSKTPQEWIDYWREIYPTDKRTEMYEKSLESTDPYERVMGLIMSGGGASDKDERGYNKVLYGYDAWEKLGKFWETTGKAMSLFPRGVARRFMSGEDDDYLQDLTKQKGLDAAEIAKGLKFVKYNSQTNEMTTPWTDSEEAFNKMWDEVKGKTDKELSDAEKLFVLERQVANRSARRDETGVSLYERVKELDQTYWKLAAYEEDLRKMDEENARDSLWAGGNIAVGNFSGTILRTLWENMVGQALTGYSMNSISDAIGTKIIGGLAKAGFSPTSAVGQGVLKFAANLVGTIPEDIVQTAVDNVLTYNDEQNQYLLDPSQMGENFKQNLLFMSVWNAALAGVKGIRKIKLIRQLKKYADLGEELDMPAADIEKTMSKATDAAKVIADGGHFEVENGKVYSVDANGKKAVMENLTVEEAQMMNKAVADMEASGKPVTNVSSSSIDTTASDATLPRPIAELEAEKANNSARLAQLEAQKKAWEENGWKDDDGADVRQREQTDYSAEEIYGTSKLEQLDSEIEDVKRKIAETDAELDTAKRISTEDGSKTKYQEAAEKVGKKADNVETDDTARAVEEGDTTKTTTESGTGTSSKVADGEDIDYKISGVDDAVDPTFKVDPTPARLQRWHARALNAIMRNLKSNLAEFHRRFGDVRASDFDWIWYNTKNGLTPDKIIGTIDPTTNRVVTQNMIDAVRWWGEQDFTKKLRMASRKALNIEGPEDLNVLGYLPHTSYDPSTMTFEEAQRGMLWKRATGKSIAKDGEYVGYGGTLEGRYRTFASNMLWDIRNKEIAASMLMEEAAMDGKNITPEEATKMAEAGKKVVKKVDDSKSSKNMVKGASKEGAEGLDDFKKAGEEVEKEAPKSGAGKGVHDAYGGMYVGSNTGTVAEQPSKLPGSVNLNAQGDTMRKISINIFGKKLSMYDGGGADLVYAPQNAFELVSRVQREGLSWREAITNFVMEHSGRKREYAEQVADKMVARMAKESKDGKITKGAAIMSLSKSFRSEAWARYRRWLVLAKFDEFNAKTKEFIDDFTFRHMQLDSFTNNQSIISKLTNKIVDLRYDSLFYGNLKNALLQVSELSRLFTSFKLGDVGSMLKRLATDADFRERVDIYVHAVAPEDSGFKSMLYDRYGQAADAMEVGEDGVHFKKLKDGKAALDDIALAPINAAESMKNRTMVAALVAEADRLRAAGKLTSDGEYLAYVRRRFERVALAQNEMGRLGLSSNPIARPMLFLQNFQMRELGMHYYNIFDPDDLETGAKMDAGGVSKGKLRWNAAKYIMKVLGTKLGATLVLARLGYDASQTLGLDPFGLANNRNNLSDEEKTVIDEQISHGLLTPFVSSGITSLFADMYFMAREAYEDAHRKTASEEAEANLNKGIGGGADWSAAFSLENLLNTGSGFIPGYTAYNRVRQMNDMMNSGWALSSTGNKMYTAPDDAVNTMLGYLFGRSATQNALEYNQNYGDDLGQTLNRTVGKFFANMFGGGYNELDAVDQQNFSGWFDGSDNDTQQFEKGKRSFRAERDRILDAYENAIRNSYDSDEIAEAKNEMNEKLEDLFNRVGRFVDAYEQQHGTITGKMVKELVNLLNTERKSINDTPEETSTKGYGENDKALERYAQLGLPNVGTYTGPTKNNPETEVKYQGSPQWRVKSGARYDLNTEATQVLRAGDAVLEDLRKRGKELYNEAYRKNDYTEFNKFQQQYLEAFDSVVGPIIATYGNGILTNKDVKNQLEEMLATSTNTGKVNLIPSEQYAKNKNGRYQSMPFESVDVGKWAQERYKDDIFKNATIRSSTTAEDDIDDIKRMISNGEKDMARARALSLKVRIDNQRRSISKEDYKWLLDFLNNGGK